MNDTSPKRDPRHKVLVAVNRCKKTEERYFSDRPSRLHPSAQNEDRHNAYLKLGMLWSEIEELLHVVAK